MALTKSINFFVTKTHKNLNIDKQIFKFNKKRIFHCVCLQFFIIILQYFIIKKYI